METKAPKKEDRRVRKTKRLLRQGLSQLMMQKSIKDITVRELAELVDINRGTFYIHYRDIYDMIDQIKEEMFQEFLATIERHNENGNQDLLGFMEDMYRYIAENHDIVLALLSRNGDIAFVSRVQDLIHSRALMQMQKRFPNESTRSFEYYFDFVAAGTTQLLRSWLEQGMQETPEKMAALVTRMVQGCSNMISSWIPDSEK